MSQTVLAVVVLFAVAAFGLLFVVARRVLRLALKLALLGSVLLALLVGALVWWWYSPGESNSRTRRPDAPTPARRAR